MKYVYGVIVVTLVALGYYLFTTLQDVKKESQQVPEGYRSVEEGSLRESPNQGTNTTDETPTEVKKSSKASVTLDPYAKVFAVKAVNYGFDVKEIKVKQGDTVTINFISSDGFHGWNIDAFAAATQKVQPGTPTSVTFVADKKGEFEYYCPVGEHRAHGMVGKLIVE